MIYNFNDADQREAAMAAKWAECCEENTSLRQQLSAALAACKVKDAILERLIAGDKPYMSEYVEALAATEPK